MHLRLPRSPKTLRIPTIRCQEPGGHLDPPHAVRALYAVKSLTVTWTHHTLSTAWQSPGPTSSCQVKTISCQVPWTEMTLSGPTTCCQGPSDSLATPKGIKTPYHTSSSFTTPEGIKTPYHTSSSLATPQDIKAPYHTSRALVFSTQPTHSSSQAPPSIATVSPTRGA